MTRWNPDDFTSALAPLERATTLPAYAFTDDGIYEREVERLFRAHWLCIGRLDQVPNPGDWRTVDLLGERLVLVRDLAGEVRVLSRICQHRAAELVSGTGHSRSFQCPYHAWTYRLDGTLGGAPHMERVAGFDRADCALPRIRHEVWEGFVFVNLDGEAEPLGPQLAPLATMLDGYDMGSLVAEETATYPSDFNWKVLVDNFMEAYHHIATHRDTLEPLFPAAASHVLDNDGPYSVLVMPSSPDHPPSVRVAKLPGLADDQQPGLVAAVVYPFHLFAPSGDNVAWYQLLPESTGRFTLRIFNCFRKDVLEDPARAEDRERQHAILRIIHEQDIAACEAVQTGLESGHFDRGRLSHLEKAIWEFNRWWCARLGDR
jgi:phenylpropionate dioxygenase-like ring-hydroxylating dioxygenase large terminal subunit